MFDKPRGRLRRTALPPRSVGLVTFSFALLGLGVVAYAVSLPSLIQVAQRSEERSFATVFVDGDGSVPVRVTPGDPVEVHPGDEVRLGSRTTFVLVEGVADMAR